MKNTIRNNSIYSFNNTKNLIVFFAVVFFICISHQNTNAQAVRWQRIYNYQNGNDVAHDAIQTFDGGYLVIGDGRSSSVFKGAFLLKLDYLGNLEWKKLFGGVDERRSVKKVTQLSDSSYLFIGNSFDSLLLFKTDSKGNIVWEKTFCEVNGEARGYSFRVTEDNNIIMCGDIFFSSPSLRIYPYVIKIDINGNLIWKRYYDDMLDIIPYDIISVKNSEYIFCASQYLRRIDSLGNVIKTNSYWSGSGFLGLINLVYVEPNIIFSGGLSDSNSLRSFHAIKVDLNDSLHWSKRFISPDNAVAEGYALCYGNGSLYMTGAYNKKGVVPFVKISTSGELELYTLIDQFMGVESYSYSLNPVKDGGFILGGNITIGPPYSSKFLAIKTDSNGYAPKPVKINFISELADNFQLHQNFPNPFNPITQLNFHIPKSTNVNIKVYDISGKKITTLINEFRHSGSYSVTFDGTDLSSGVYFYRIEAGDFVQTRKMVLMK